MRGLIVIALLVGVAFVILLVLTDLARELSRQSFQASPDLDSSDDWDIALDEFGDTDQPVLPYTEPRPASSFGIARTQGYSFRGSSNALDDLRSAL
jgi:hypothetical protein